MCATVALNIALTLTIIILVRPFAPSSDALVPSSFLLLLVRHLLLEAMHLFLIANIVTTSVALVSTVQVILRRCSVLWTYKGTCFVYLVY